ncbi:MAG: hypothetical protein R2712_32365, partial [Vicinamibacterales bacterium]
MPPGSFLRRLRRGRPIIVVSGLPRSGTSLAMQMLQAGGVPVASDGARAADDSNPRGYLELESVKGLDRVGDHAWLAACRGRAVKVVSPLLTHLPEDYDYQVVFMRRDLDEVLASQNAMLESRGEARGAADARMRAVYEEHLAQVERFVARRDCFATLWLDYARVVASPGTEADRMA